MKKELVVSKPKLWVRHPLRLACPGCHHATIERVICEVLEDLGIEENTIGVSGVGCSVFIFNLIQLDAIMVAHGRCPDAATGIKRIYGGRPFVFTIQGDGDCIAIGTESLIHAAARSEKITVIMVNNGNYGTTGGQLAPTTLVCQVTTTTPKGRNPGKEGYEIHAAELVAGIKGAAYSARGAVNTPANFQQTKKYLKSAFQKQLDNVGFSFVEILSACPVGWRKTPLESLKWIEERMIPEFPLGEFKNVEAIG